MKSFKELRTDPHRPSVMDPADYVFVGAADEHPVEGYVEIDHRLLARHGVETGSSDPHSVTSVPFYDATEDGRPNFRCHHCGKHGSNIRYFCFFLHKPTHQVIVVGRVCAENRLSLSSREEFESFLNRRDRTNAHAQWARSHADEVNYLKEYRNQHQAGGMFQEFLDSLVTKLDQYGSLTENQINGLRKWMAKGKPWEQGKVGRSDFVGDADRHQAEVTHYNEPPTEKQIAFLNELGEQLHQLIDIPHTRIAASDLINKLKAEVQNSASPQTATRNEPATSKQLSFINNLMEERKLTPEQRHEARRQFDTGLTKTQATRWIDKLQELPTL